MAAMYDFLWIIVIFVNFIITQIEGKKIKTTTLFSLLSLQ
jgi:hypothetical protein